MSRICVFFHFQTFHSPQGLSSSVPHNTLYSRDSGHAQVHAELLATMKVTLDELVEHNDALKNRAPLSLAPFLKDWWKKEVGPFKASIACSELVELLVAWLVKNG